MKIIFVLPWLSPTGGVGIVAEHADRLAQRGHQVTLLRPLLGGPDGTVHSDFIRRGARRLRNTAVNLVRSDLRGWSQANFRLMTVPWIGDRFIPPADVI